MFAWPALQRSCWWPARCRCRRMSQTSFQDVFDRSRMSGFADALRSYFGKNPGTRARILEIQRSARRLTPTAPNPPVVAHVLTFSTVPRRATALLTCCGPPPARLSEDLWRLTSPGIWLWHRIETYRAMSRISLAADGVVPGESLPAACSGYRSPTVAPAKLVAGALRRLAWPGPDGPTLRRPDNEVN